MNPADLHKLIQKRKTEKILGDPDSPSVISASVREQNDTLVKESVVTAGFAPFHYPRTAEIAEPWRAHILWNDACNTLARYLAHEKKILSKEPMLCAAASALVLITWHPQFPQSENEKEKLVDVEHLAATGAMTQNLLLLLTAYEMKNYWSSGGVLGSSEIFQKLGIPTEGRLLGAIFIQYPEASDPSHEIKPGAHREKRSQGWIRDVGLVSREDAETRSS